MIPALVELFVDDARAAASGRSDEDIDFEFVHTQMEVAVADAQLASRLSHALTQLPDGRHYERSYIYHSRKYFE